MCEILPLPTKDCTKKNVPGVLLGFVVEKENIDTISAPSNGAVATITLKAGKEWKPIIGLPKQANILPTSRHNLENGTDYFMTTLNFRYPSLSKELFSGLESYTNGVEVVFLMKHRDGRVFLYGDTVGCVLTEVNGSTGTSAEGQFNGADLVFLEDGANHYPYEFTGTLPTV
jgi:hypothetical protein